LPKVNVGNLLELLAWRLRNFGGPSMARSKNLFFNSQLEGSAGHGLSAHALVDLAI
jgi:hypothetical protein